MQRWGCVRNLLAFDAGEPMNNDNTYCPANSTSCYHYSTATAAFTAASTACQARGGGLVSWNTEAEHFDVGGCGQAA